MDNFPNLWMFFPETFHRRTPCKLPSIIGNLIQRNPPFPIHVKTVRLTDHEIHGRFFRMLLRVNEKIYQCKVSLQGNKVFVLFSVNMSLFLLCVNIYSLQGSLTTRPCSPFKHTFIIQLANRIPSLKTVFR